MDRPNARTADDPSASTEVKTEGQLLTESVEKIVISRERTPRNPRWQRAWWRTLVRFNARLNELQAPAHPPADAGQKGTIERP